ncbi:MAG: PadR family transcriptional regulator [Gemmatimonadota bacterium]|nr:PadR family transcriptional regulator [Gemmatimonadota bacterium]
MENRKHENEWRSVWSSWFGEGSEPPAGFGPPAGFFGAFEGAFDGPFGGPWGGPGGRRGPGGGGAGGFGGRRGPGRRIFDRGDLKYAILRLLATKPMHGYEVMQALEERSRGWYSASAGSVYPVLQLLRDQGYVTSQETDGRHIYSVTDEGRAFLDEHSKRADDVMDRVSEFANRFTSEAKEVKGVFRSFMKVFREGIEQMTRLSDDPATVNRIREILERAANEIRDVVRQAGDTEGKPLDEI